MKLYLLVTALHLVMLSLFVVTKTTKAPLPKKAPLKVAVKVEQRPQETREVVVTKAPAKKKVVKEKKEVVIAKAPAKKKVVNKEQTEKSIDKSKIAALLQKSLKTTKAQETKIEKKSISLQSASLQKVSYEEELVLYLQEQLKMPISETIRLAITLTSEGKLLALSVERCKEDANRTYLEKRVPQLFFPSFIAHYPKEKTRSFSLTLYIK